MGRRVGNRFTNGSAFSPMPTRAYMPHEDSTNRQRSGTPSRRTVCGRRACIHVTTTGQRWLPHEPMLQTGVCNQPSTDGNVPGHDCHRQLSRDYLALDTTQSALLITNGFDGGQTANLDGVTSYKGTSIPVAVVHSTGGCFPHDVEESAPGQFELGSPGSIREEGVGTIQLKRSGNDLEYRATVPTSGGPAVTIQASAVLASTHVTPR